MTSEKKEEEEIIELTEVIEEDFGPMVQDPGKGAIPLTLDEKTASRDIGLSGREDLKPGGEESRKSRDIQAISEVVPPPFLSNFESEVRAMKEALKAQVEEWMASDGPRVLERVAREMFPEIAEAVLRREIEKLKAEFEEKA